MSSDRLLLQDARSAIEAAQEVIGQCDCIFGENPEKDPRRLWYQTRDRYFARLAAVRGPAPGGGSPQEEKAGLERAARECEEGAVGPGVMFEWDGCLHALGENGVAALKYMAAQFREGAKDAG